MSIVVERNNWSNWLNAHPTRGAYDKNPDKVKDLLNGSDGIGKFKKLTLSKNVVILSRHTLGVKLQATFLHSVVGVPIFSEDMHFVARSGMEFGTGIEVDPKSMFRSTTSINVPSVLEMMKVGSDEDFVNLKQNGE